MSTYLDRSIELLGEEKINAISNAKILIVGVGGVGGTALESLARTGFKKFVIIDCDSVDITNLNRQVLFTSNDFGVTKVIAAKKRLLSISSDLEIDTYECKIGETLLNELNLGKIDFIVDAIDYVPGKLHIYQFALENNIKFISSLGMGNRIDPEKVTITTLNKTENDPLAKKIRYEAKKQGLDTKLIPVVFSKEEPLIKSPKPASLMMVPSTAGLLITKYVLLTII